MIHEIKTMSEYNPRYSEHGQLKWQKINDGRHPKNSLIQLILIKLQSIKII